MEVENSDNIFFSVYGGVVVAISTIIALHSTVLLNHCQYEAIFIFKASQSLPEYWEGVGR